MDNKKQGVQIDFMTLKLTAKNILEFSEKIVSVYEFHKRIRSSIDLRPLRPQLIRVLSMYVLYGISKDVKRMVIESLDIKDETRINMFNKELRDLGFIEKHLNMNSTLDFLNPELEHISKLIRSIFEEKNIEVIKSGGVESVKIDITLNIPFNE